MKNNFSLFIENTIFSVSCIFFFLLWSEDNQTISIVAIVQTLVAIRSSKFLIQVSVYYKRIEMFID